MSGEDYQAKTTIQVLKELCKTEPYLTNGILYFKSGDAHNFACYTLPADLNGEMIDPHVVIVGQDISEGLEEMASAMHQSERQQLLPKKHNWRILPYSDSDLSELENALEKGFASCNHGRKYFTLRPRAMTSYLDQKQETAEEPREDLKRLKETLLEKYSAKTKTESVLSFSEKA